MEYQFIIRKKGQNKLLLVKIKGTNLRNSFDSVINQNCIDFI